MHRDHGLPRPHDTVTQLIFERNAVCLGSCLTRAPPPLRQAGKISLVLSRMAARRAFIARDEGVVSRQFAIDLCQGAVVLDPTPAELLEMVAAFAGGQRLNGTETPLSKQVPQDWAQA